MEQLIDNGTIVYVDARNNLHTATLYRNTKNMELLVIKGEDHKAQLQELCEVTGESTDTYEVLGAALPILEAFGIPYSMDTDLAPEEIKAVKPEWF